MGLQMVSKVGLIVRGSGTKEIFEIGQVTGAKTLIVFWQHSEITKYFVKSTI